jgi:predicted transcriptional regulator
MAAIKEVSQRVVIENGKAVEIIIRNGLLVDHLLEQGMRAEGYRVMTGRDVFPTVSRSIKDYLIRTGVITE